MSYTQMLFRTASALRQDLEVDELPPLRHMVQNSTLQITLEKGKGLISAEPVKENQSTIVPVTPDSRVRTSNTTPHPLCDKFKYLLAGEKGHQQYMALLGEWRNSLYTHPFLDVIYEYLRGETLERDLNWALGELTPKKDWSLRDPANGKLLHDEFVRWSVVGVAGEEETRTWKNRDLFQAWENFYDKKYLEKEKRCDFCMLSGEKDYVQKLHAKNLIPGHANGKYISANDQVGFTYRGRFATAEEAVTIGDVSSENMHAAMQWLFKNHAKAVQIGKNKQDRVCLWSVEAPEKEFSYLTLQEASRDAEEETEEREELIEEVSTFEKHFNDVLFSAKKLNLPEDSHVVCAIMGGATDGRVALKGYWEYGIREFCHTMNRWYESCRWRSPYKRYQDTGSPGVKEIADCAYGALRGQGGQRTLCASDEMSGAVQLELIRAKMSGKTVPESVVRALEVRCGHLAIYQELQSKLLFTALSLMRKFYKDRYGREYQPMIDESCNERSYLFGRLLALYDKMEEDILRQAETGKPRTTNALRLQAMYADRPMDTAAKLDRDAKGVWMPKILSGKYGEAVLVKYKKLLGEIWERLEALRVAGEAMNQKLEPTYLFGYYVQKQALFSKSAQEEK